MILSVLSVLPEMLVVFSYVLGVYTSVHPKFWKMVPFKYIALLAGLMPAKKKLVTARWKPPTLTFFQIMDFDIFGHCIYR